MYETINGKDHYSHLESNEFFFKFGFNTVSCRLPLSWGCLVYTPCLLHQQLLWGPNPFQDEHRDEVLKVCFPTLRSGRQSGGKFVTSLAHAKRHHSFTGSTPYLVNCHNCPPFSQTNTLHKCQHHPQMYTKYFLKSCYYVYTSLKIRKDWI